MAVHEWSCLSGLSVDEFQDLPIQFGQVLKAKNFNRCGILLVGLGGPTLMRKTMKWESGVFPCHGMAELTRILFGHERGNFRSTRLALIAVILILLYKSMGFFWEKTQNKKGSFSLYEKHVFSPVLFLYMIFAEITFCPSINLEQPVMVLVLFFLCIS